MTAFASFRLVSQLAGFVTGILIVRSLAPDQFALYSVCTAVTAAVGVVADSGIASRLLGELGKTRTVSEGAALLRAAAGVKTVLTAVLAVPGIGLLAYLLLANGAPPGTALLLCGLVLVTIPPVVTSSMLGVALQAASDFKRIQMVDLVGAILRLALIVALAAFHVATVPLLLLGALLILLGQRIAEARAVRSWFPPHQDPSTPTGSSLSPRELSETFRSAIRASLPTSLLMIVGEQLIFVVLTLHGNTRSIAEVAALGRYAAVFTVLNALMMTIFATWLSKAGTGRPFLRAARKLLSVYALVAIAYATGSAILAGPLTALLGPSYADLTREFALVSAGVAISNFASYGIGAINHSRGWLRLSWLYIPAVGLWLTVGLVWIPLDTSLGASVFAASLSLPVLVSQSSRFFSGLITDRGLGRNQGGRK